MEILYQPVKAGSSLQSCRNELITRTQILKQNQNLNLLTNFNNNEHIGSTKASTTNSPENAKSFHHTYSLCYAASIPSSYHQKCSIEHQRKNPYMIKPWHLVSPIFARKNVPHTKMRKTKEKTVVETGYQEKWTKNTKHN